MPLLTHGHDVAYARDQLDRRRGANLRFALRKRFSWMRRYLGPDAVVAEVGCGAGFSQRFLTAKRLLLTDAEVRPWISCAADAQALPFRDRTLDAVVANNVIHHLAYPDRFLREAIRVLRDGGHLLVQECNCGKTTEWALWLTGHEGFDWSADPFDPSRPCCDPADPWAANCAIPNLLFDDLERFRARYPELAVVEAGLSEFFVHFNNGGMSTQVPYVPLAEPAMRVVDTLDRVLVAVAPRFFAAQRRIALRRA